MCPGGDGDGAVRLPRLAHLLKGLPGSVEGVRCVSVVCAGADPAAVLAHGRGVADVPSALCGEEALPVGAHPDGEAVVRFVG